jgi:hypothetical protein
MTTDTQDLIARLRAPNGSLGNEAADKLEALQAEVTQFRALAKANSDSLGEALQERDAALARLAEMGAQPSQAGELSDADISKLAAPYGNSSIQGFDHIKAYARAIIAAINAKEQS